MKTLFIDVDGTLVGYSNGIPASAVKAIRAARINGHRVYICTGRSEAEVYPDIWAIGLDGMIGGNGAYVKDGNKVIMHQHLSYEQCREVVDWCHQRKHEFYLESNSGLYGSENFREAALPVMQEYSGRKGRSRDIKVEDAFPDMIFGAELYRDDVNKISFILNDYQDYLDALRDFPHLQVGKWGGAGETALFGDFGVKDISKKTAVDVLMNYLGRDLKDTIAFGDAEVDIPMFEICSYSVAMGSGTRACREAADYVTSGVEEDGLYNAFVHLGLIREGQKSEYPFYGWNNSNVLPITEGYGELTPCKLYDLLSELWCRETCAPRMQKDWCEENKTLGQCSITAFLVQDIYGGKVYGVPLGDGNYHCFNVVGDCVFDLTSEQFLPEKLEYSLGNEQFRENHFRKAEKKERYLKLKNALEGKIKEIG